jgi:hypothetical protein
MAYGKMNADISIVSTTPVKDTDGFATTGDTVLATVRAYKEDKHGSEKWANMAAFSEASAIFRFRKIPGLTVTTEHVVTCEAGRYRIISAEDVCGRGMYVEVVAEKLEGSVN